MLIKYKGGIYKRVDASSEVVEKLQSIIEKRLKAAVELLKVRGLRFSLSKEQIKDNLVDFYVTVTWSSSPEITGKQKDQVKEQLDHLLLQGLKPLESMAMFKEHNLRLYGYRWEGNKLNVATLTPDASKESSGRPIAESRANDKLHSQYDNCVAGIRGLHRAIVRLVKEEDDYGASFTKNIGEISAVAPKLAAELKRSFDVLVKSAKESNAKLEKAMQTEKTTNGFDIQSVKEAIKQLQSL